MFSDCFGWFACHESSLLNTHSLSTNSQQAHLESVFCGALLKDIS